MIEFVNVSKTYPSGTHALNGTTLSIDSGEFVFIVGASGAGKSTLLKMIMGEETPSEGKIVVDNQVVNDLKRKNLPYLRRKMGIVFQDFRLIDKMTVFDNIAFAMRVTGKTNPRAVKKAVKHVLALVGLEGKEKRRPSELSGGEQQRVSLARALINNPKIIIADEPTGNIDPDLSFEIMELLNKINKTGTTVLVVTHEKELVEKFDHRIIELQRGKVVLDSGKSSEGISAEERIKADMALNDDKGEAGAAFPTAEDEEIILDETNALNKTAKEKTSSYQIDDDTDDSLNANKYDDLINQLINESESNSM